MAIPMRSIWVAIRGINYTDRATRQVGRNIDYLIRKQQQLKQAAVMMIAGGAMWVAMGAMAMMGIMKVMEASREGTRIMRVFSRSTQKLMKAMGDAFAKTLGPMISALTGLFTWIAKAPPIIHKVIAALVMLATTYLILRGISMVFAGAIKYVTANKLIAAAATKQLTLAQVGAIPATKGLSLSFVSLGASIKAALGPFILMMTFAMMLGKEGGKVAAAIGVIATVVLLLAKALWAAAIPMSILTVGLGLAAGLAAGGLMAATMPSYQVGTRMVQRTGPAIVHAGEPIGAPAKVRSEMEERREGPSISRWNVTVNISGPIQTKADKEELRPMILKVLKDAFDNKR